MTRARDLSNLIGSGNYTSTTFTATAGQTVFTIAHTQGFIQVFMNGLLLDETTDYTSNGTAVTLTEAATAGDELEVVKYNTFSVGDAMRQSDADTRYVNASGDTMTNDLILQHTNGNGFEINVNESDNWAIQRFVTEGTDDNRYIIAYGPNHPTEAGNFAVKNIKAGGEVFIEAAGGAEGLRVTSSGYVIKPRHPSFCASRQTDQTFTVNGQNLDLVYDQVIHNIGSHYNSTTGRFTAPVDGSYHFSLNLRIDNIGSGYTWLKLYKNGTSQIDGGFPNHITQQTGSYFTLMCSGTVRLNSGDYVSPLIYSSGDANFDFENASYFSGHLIG